MGCFKLNIENPASLRVFNGGKSLVSKKNVSPYLYGYQGQEKDDEVKGEGNSVNYKYRMHDPRIGRFFSRDALAFEYAYNSPYAFSENRVIDAFELEGLEKVSFNGTFHDFSGKSYERIKQVLGWRENVHQGHISAERVQNWNDNWYIYINNLTDGVASGNHSIGTEISFYSNREDWINNKPFKTVTEVGFLQWMYGGEASISYKLEGSAGGDGGPDKFRGKEGYENGGKQVLFGAVSVALAPFTIAAGTVWGITIGSASLVNGLDDFFSNEEGESLTISLVQDPFSKQKVKNLKGLIIVGSVATGGYQILAKGAKDVPTLIGTTNDINALMGIINEYLETTLKTSEKTTEANEGTEE